MLPHLAPNLSLSGITNDEAEAKRKLLQQQVDVVAVAPPNAYQTIRNSEQAIFTLYHNEIDPFQVDYVNVFGKVYVDEVNRRILQDYHEKRSERSLDGAGQAASRPEPAPPLSARPGSVMTSTAAREHQRELNKQRGRVGPDGGRQRRFARQCSGYYRTGQRR